MVLRGLLFKFPCISKFSGGLFGDNSRAGVPPLQFEEGDLQDMTGRMDEMMRSLGLLSQASTSPRPSGIKQ